jgi:hypothetical protein
MGAGWWVEDEDRDGPPEGLEALLKELDVRLPELKVPEPPINEDD